MATSLLASVAERLFTPHGLDAYTRWLGPGSLERSSAPITNREASSSGRRVVAGAAVSTTRSASAVGLLERPEASESPVRFARSGTESMEPGPNLLEIAEEAAVEVRSRCRRGICGTCTTPLVEGTVRDLRTGDEATAPTPIRLCVSEPCGPVTLDL